MGNKYIEMYHARRAIGTDAPVTEDSPTGDTLSERVDKVLDASDPGEVVSGAPADPLEAVFTKGAVKAARLVGNTIEVAMTNGTTVIHQNFTPELFAEWKAAASPASWYHTNLRLKTKEHPVKNG